MKTKSLNPTPTRKISNVGYLRTSLFFAYFRIIVWSLRLDRPSYKLFARRMHSILRKSGTLFLVRYLKEAHLVVQKYVSQEYMYKSTYPLGITAGLPSIIPGSIRLQLKKKDPVAIRGVLAFLSVFRVLKVPSILKLETITDPFKGISDSIPNLELGRVFTTLHPRRRPFSLESPLEFLRLNTAGPNGSSSVRCILFDVHAWKFDPLRPTLEKFITLLEGPSSSFLEMLYTE
jgi:hypothetical protein